LTLSPLARDFRAKAVRALASARELQDCHPDGSVNRSYYEMFDIARAALLSAGVREDELPRTHADARSTARCGESHSARHLDRRTAALIVPNWMTATGCCLRWCVKGTKHARSCSRSSRITRTHDRDSRGAAIDEDKIPVISTPPGPEVARSVRYLHAQRRKILHLEKPLSLDDVQYEIYRAAPPPELIGGAGSGKTALTLEKLKQVDGDVLYVTHSAYLAQNGRNLSIRVACSTRGHAAGQRPQA
jgi:hypothetical protein